jgi:putative Holliday junction resolvase
MAQRLGALAIDHGTKRTGFAAADPLRISLNALEPFHGPGDAPALLEHVARLCSERDIDTFVVGMPFNMDGSEGPRAAEVRAFSERLRARFPGLAIALVDERLSTKEAEELLRESGLRGEKARALRDSFSALVVLRDWIATEKPG